MNQKIFIKIIMVSFIWVFLFRISAFAGTYWVNPTGKVSWSDAQSETPLNGTSCCSLLTASRNAVAGDKIYLRGGTYNDQTIEPSNSGNLNSRIIFTAYNGETAILKDPEEENGAPYDYGVYLNHVNYIVINGITVQEQEFLIFISNGASYNEIKNCTVHTANYDPGDKTGHKAIQIRDGGGNDGGCQHNWIHHNLLYNAGHISGTDCQDSGGIVMVGAHASDYISNHNTIEENMMYWGGHYVVQTNTQYNVVRNNIVHNDAFMQDDNYNCVPKTDSWRDTGKWGNRCIVINDGNDRDKINNLVENNRVGYGSNPPDGGGANGIVLTGKGNIVRYNYIYDAGQKGIYFKQITKGFSNNNRVYNNTIYHTGYSYPTFRSGAGIYVHRYSIDNVIVNNIIYGGHEEMPDFTKNAHENNILQNNWFTDNGNGDPIFINPDISKYRSKTLPDLSLSSMSGAIDKGTYLTQAKGSATNSATLVVDDALFFQDGTWGSSLSNVQADYIAIGTVANTAKINSINYNTNTITLANAKTWSDKAKVWLLKKSDGKVVLYGSAPDIGAHELTLGYRKSSDINPSSPAEVQNIRVRKVQD